MEWLIIKNIKNLSYVILLITIIISLNSCTNKNNQQDKDINNQQSQKEIVNISTLKGSYTIPSLYLIHLNNKNSTLNKYNIDVVNSTTKIIEKAINNQIDIAAVPTIVASDIYNKTDGNFKAISINTSGSLSFIINKSIDIKDIKSFKGKTINTYIEDPSQKYILEHIFIKNNLTIGKDIKINYIENILEFTQDISDGKIDIAIIPEPFASSTLKDNPKLIRSLNISEEWNKIYPESNLAMGVLIASKSFIENKKDILDKFLLEYDRSTSMVKRNPPDVQNIAENIGLMSSDLAKLSIPKYNSIYIHSEKMKSNIIDILSIVNSFSPDLIGNKLPLDDFYYFK